MRKATTLALVLLASFGLTGCRTTMRGNAVAEGSDSKAGLVYHLSRPVFTIDVKDRAGDKEAEPIYELRTGTGADPERRFSIRLDRGTFSKDVFNLKLRADGTLESLGASADSQVTEIVTALGSLAVSALGFPSVGAAGLTALRSTGIGALDAALEADLCSGAVTLPDFANLRCAADLLLATQDAARCSQHIVSCTAGGPSMTIPAASPAVAALGSAALEPVAAEVWRLIDSHDLALWDRLDDIVVEADFRTFKIDVGKALSGLAALHELERQLAARLDTDPRPDAPLPPDLALFRLPLVTKNLNRLILKGIDEAKSGADAILSGQAATDFKVATEFLTALGVRSEVVAPGLFQKAFDEALGELEKELAKSFADGELATPALAKDKESSLLLKFRSLRKVREIQKTISAPATPRQRIAKLLKAKKLRAEEVYARYVGDPSTKGEFIKALDAYTKAVDRFLEVDGGMQITVLNKRRKDLEDFFQKPVPNNPSGNESKAYRDYREELDKILERAGNQVSALNPKEKENLPRGTSVSHTLDRIASCVIGSPTQLDVKHNLLDLAEMWIRFGGKDAVVFRTRTGKPATKEWLDCGTDPFAASEARQPDRLEKVPSKRQVASGMNVRKLTLADLDGAFDPKKENLFHGVLVQVPALYDVVALLLSPSGERVLKTATLSLPAYDEFLDLGFKGGLMRSQELTVALHPSGVISEYKLTSTQEVSDTLKGVADVAKGVNEKLDAIEPKSKDPVEVENSQLKLEIFNRMLKANRDALVNGQPLPFPDLLAN